jgi:hypothetical protein
VVGRVCAREQDQKLWGRPVLDLGEGSESPVSPPASRLRGLPPEDGRGKQFSSKDKRISFYGGQSNISLTLNDLDRVLLVPELLSVFKERTVRWQTETKRGDVLIKLC